MRVALLFLALFLAAPPPVSAACTGVNISTGRAQSVREIYRTRVNHAGNYIAEATHDRKSGRPLIIYYRRYNGLPATYRTFVRQHECCHHILQRQGRNSRDEIAANCCALRRMGARGRTLARIKSTMIKHEINSDALFAYHGAGAAFWTRTAARCLGARGR